MEIAVIYDPVFGALRWDEAEKAWVGRAIRQIRARPKIVQRAVEIAALPGALAVNIRRKSRGGKGS